MEEKPRHCKPELYAIYFQGLKEIARSHGYNLLVHGSMNRDLDLVAVPWKDEVSPEIDLINALTKHLVGVIAAPGHEDSIYMHSYQPGGRSNYIINLFRYGKPDPQYYLDISVTPLVKRGVVDRVKSPDDPHDELHKPLGAFYKPD